MGRSIVLMVICMWGHDAYGSRSAVMMDLNLIPKNFLKSPKPIDICCFSGIIIIPYKLNQTERVAKWQTLM